MGSSSAKIPAKTFAQHAMALGFIEGKEAKKALLSYELVEGSADGQGFEDFLVREGFLSEQEIKDVTASITSKSSSPVAAKPKQKTTVRRRVADFEIISRVGQGGMGAVYKARQVSIDREIALKILPSDLAKDPEFRERFLREARAVAKLNHPNIVAGIDVGCDNGVYYFAMEFIDGESLGQRLSKQGKLNEVEALDFVRQTALALKHAHVSGLLHRDVKPDNILIARDGVAKLADLGLARSSENPDQDVGSDQDSDEPADLGLTRKGKVVGTPYYISPEQARGKKDLTPGTDLYSLGATLFHLLTGERPYSGSSAGSVMRKHVKDPVPDPRAIVPSLSAEVGEICMKLMQKEPQDRFRDGKVLAETLEKLIEKLEPRRVPPAIIPVRRDSNSSKVARSSKVAKGSKVAIVPAVASVSSTGGSQSNSKLQRPVRRSQAGGGDWMIGIAVLAAIALVGIFLTGRNDSNSNDSALKEDSQKSIEKRDEKTVSQPKPSPRDLNKAKSPSPPPSQKVVITASADPKPEVHEVYKSTYEARLEPIESVKSVPDQKADGEAASLRQQERKLLDTLVVALNEANYRKADREVQKFLDEGSRVATAQFGKFAIQAIKEFDEEWNAKREKLSGQTVKVGGLVGTVSSVQSNGLYIEMDRGAQSLKKWEDISAGDRLRMMGHLEKDRPSLWKQGLYRLVHGEQIEGAQMLLQAHQEKTVPMPEAWVEAFENLRQSGLAQAMDVDFKEIVEFDTKRDWNRLRGRIELFRKKYGESGSDFEGKFVAMEGRLNEALMDRNKPQADETKETKVANETKENKGVENPDVKEVQVTRDGEAKNADGFRIVAPPKNKPLSQNYFASLFRGQVEIRSSVPGHVRIRYDFTSADQLKDFKAAGRGEWAFKDNFGLEFKGGGRNSGKFIHNGVCVGQSNFMVEARFWVQDEGGGFGVGTGASASGPQYVSLRLGGSRGNGTALILGQSDRGSSSTSRVSYSSGQIYRMTLNREDMYWEGRAGSEAGFYKSLFVGKRKRSELPGEWNGQAYLYSEGASLIIKSMVIEGFLDHEWARKFGENGGKQ